MFPHRTAFVDKREKRLIGPEEAGDYEFTMKRHGLEETGKGLLIGSRGQIYTRIKVNESQYDGMDNVTDRFEDVASTGLEDSEENEIFEGSIFKENDRDITKVAYLDWANYQIQTVSFIESYCNFSRNESITLIGHALTDHDLVPDGFDVEEYFGLAKTHD